MKKRIVITGMGVISPIGDTLQNFYNNLIAGKSGITWLKTIDTSRIESKIGGDLGNYDYKTRILNMKNKLPEDVYRRLKKIAKNAPFATKLSLIAAVDAYIDGQLNDQPIDRRRFPIILGGSNFHNQYIEKNILTFLEEPDYIDGLMGINMFDPDSAACIADVLKLHGPMYTVGGMCASAGLALRSAINEIRYNDNNIALAGGGVLQYSAVGSKAMINMDAISYRSFNEDPQKASRPFDINREGFVPSHGTGMLLIEDLTHALSRGARIYAEILDVETCNDGTHLPVPSVEGQSWVMNEVLKKNKIYPEQIDYINAHATSTPLGDTIEIASIKNVFKKHADRLKVNATKSMIGHVGWSAHSIELIASVLQMNNSKLHQSINIDKLDPEIDIDVCKDRSISHQVNYFIKNSFGFGGINCCTLVKKYAL